MIMCTPGCARRSCARPPIKPHNTPTHQKKAEARPQRTRVGEANDHVHVGVRLAQLREAAPHRRRHGVKGGAARVGGHERGLRGDPADNAYLVAAYPFHREFFDEAVDKRRPARVDVAVNVRLWEGVSESGARRGHASRPQRHARRKTEKQREARATHRAPSMGKVRDVLRMHAHPPPQRKAKRKRGKLTTRPAWGRSWRCCGCMPPAPAA